MTHPRTRLTALLATLLAGPALVGCGPLDDEACLAVDVEATCPPDDAAADQLVGTQTCESPVRKVVATGTLVSETDIEAHEGTYGPVDAYTECCYEARYKTVTGQSCVIGRPVRHDGEAQVAPVEPRGDWLLGEPPGLRPVGTEALAAQWRRDGQLEHASVAAFARLTLDLMALGAPADLVQRATEAQADEVRHARQCFALATRLDGQPMGPASLALPSADPVDLVSLAVASFEEGCVGETLAVCRAAVQLRQATDPAVRAVLEGIVADEARHAALAWDIVHWALQVGGSPVREALVRAAGQLSLPAEALEDAPAWALEEAFVAALDQVVRPGLSDLLAA